MLSRCSVAVFAIMIVTPVGLHAEPLADVLDNMVAAYGGEKNVRKLDRVVQEWDVLALMRNKQGTDKRSIQLPRQLKVELTYPDKQETRVLDGDAGYAVFDDREPAVASNMQRSAMQLQLMRFYSPLTLRERIDSLELSKTDEHLTLTLREEGLQADYVVDTETWYIVKVVGTLAVNGATMQFMTEYAEFAKVDGVVMHHRENKWVGTTNTAVLRLRHVELGVDFDDDEFLPRRNETGPLVAGLESPVILDTK